MTKKKEKKKMVMSLDNDKLINDVSSESPLMETDLGNIKEFLEVVGGTVIINTSDYEIRINKNSVSTDIKMAFANALIEVVGPEAKFEDKVKLIRSFLHTVKEVQMSNYASDAGSSVGMGYT